MFSAAETEVAAALDAGTTANLACFEWLDHRNTVSEKFGAPPAQPCPARARFKFGNCRLCEARYAAGSPIGLAGGPG